MIARGDLRDAAARDEPVPAAGVALVDDRHRPGDRARTSGDVLASFVAQRLNEKFPVGLVVASGFGIVAAGQNLMLLLLKGGGHSYAADILPAWFLIGIGFGLSIPTIIGSATTTSQRSSARRAVPVIDSGRQSGGVFGTAILVVILGEAATTGDPTQYYHPWWVAAAACAVAGLTSLGLTPVAGAR